MFEEIRFPHWLSVGFLQVSALYSASQHIPDVNWDSQNTYTYSAYQFLNFRYYQDWLAGGLNGLNPPFLQIPNFILSHFGEWATTVYLISFLLVLQTLIYNLFLILFIIPASSKMKTKDRVDLKSGKSSDLEVISSILSVFSLLSPLLLSELGTTMGDWLAIPILVLGLIFFLMTIHLHSPLMLGASGFLFTAATCLKLSNAPFLIAVVMTIISFAFTHARDSLKRLSIFFLGSMVGVLLFSPWYLFIYKLTGNPIFPYYNAVFKSPYYAEVNARDLRWELNSLSELSGLFRGTWTNNLLEFEARYLWWAFTILTVLLYFVVLGFQKFSTLRFFRKKSKGIEKLTQVEKHFVLYVIFAFLIWAKFFFYARYAMFVEMLLPAVCGVLIFKIFGKKSFRMQLITSLGLLGLIFLHVPNWNLYQAPENTQTISKSLLTSDWKWQIERQKIPEGPHNYYIDGECACSFVLPSLGVDSSFLRLDNEIYGWVRTYPDRVKRKIDSGEFTRLISRGNSVEEVSRLNELLKSISESRMISIDDAKSVSTLNGTIYVYKLIDKE